MSFLHSRRPSHGTIVAYLALFVALGGGAYAATGGSFVGSNGAINGCVSKRGGALEVLKPGKKCPKSTVALAFDAQGQAGAPGQNGAPGQSGAPGQNGAVGGVGSTGAAGATGPLGPSFAAVDDIGEGTPVASPNQAGFEVSKTINLPVASRLLVFASGLYGFECAAACTDSPGLYVDNVPVPGTSLGLTGTASQFVTSMGITSGVLAAGAHTVKWTDNGSPALERSGPINSTGVVAAIATG